jgi:hypothetical protein
MVGIAYSQHGTYRDALPLLRASTLGARPHLISIGADEARVTVRPTQIYATYASIWAKCYETVCLCELGELSSASASADAALELAEALGMAITLGGALTVSAFVHARLGELDRASGFMTRWRNILERTDTTDASTVFLQATVDHSIRGLTESISEAIPPLERLFGSPGNVRWRSMTGAHLAEAYRHIGRIEHAVATAHRAIDVSLRCHQPGQEAWSRYTLGRVLAAQDSGAGDTVREALDESLRLAQQLGMRPLEGQCLLEIGSLRTVAPKERQEHLDAASRIFHEVGMTFWAEQATRARDKLLTETAG